MCLGGVALRLGWRDEVVGRIGELVDFAGFFFLSFRLYLTLVFADHRHHSMRNAMKNVVVALYGGGYGILVPYRRF